MVVVINVFFIDLDPDVAARQLCDKHVVKMIVETGQLLSTAHRVIDGREVLERRVKKTGAWVDRYDPITQQMLPYWVAGPDKVRNVKTWKLPDHRDKVLYASSHMQHPSGIWARKTVDNYMWLFHHMDTMMQEYTYRYDKIHSAERIMHVLQDPPNNLTATGMTPAPSCMPDECKVGDVVTNYRLYYNMYKRHIFNWKRRPVPDWIVP